MGTLHIKVLSHKLCSHFAYTSLISHCSLTVLAALLRLLACKNHLSICWLSLIPKYPCQRILLISYSVFPPSDNHMFMVKRHTGEFIIAYWDHLTIRQNSARLLTWKQLRQQCHQLKAVCELAL